MLLILTWALTGDKDKAESNERLLWRVMLKLISTGHGDKIRGIKDTGLVRVQ